MSRLRTRVVLAAGVCSLAMSVAIAGTTSATSTTEPTPEPGAVEILPPDESWGGVTRGDLVAQWWQRVITMPEEINPYFDPTGERCGYQQSGSVFLLPGYLSEGIVERTCVVPEGTAIFVYVSGSTCGTVEQPPYFARTEEEMRACVDAMVEQEVLDFRATVNGQSVADLDAYLTTSSLFTLTYPEDNWAGVDPGVGQHMAASYNFIIAPPPPGEYEIFVSEIIAGRNLSGQRTTVIVEAPQIIEPTGTEAPQASEADVTESPSTT
jgi:hypothetical protein